MGGYQYVSEFQDAALQASGVPPANLVIASSLFAAPLSIAFDSHNGLWITFDVIDDNFPPSVIGISRSDLDSIKRGKHVTPKVIVTPRFPGKLAFDRSDNLWITSDTFVAGKPQATIIELRRSQLETTGRHKPKTSITSPGFNPWVMRFDASDDLWVGQFLLASNSVQMLRFAPKDRHASGPANPGLIVNLPYINFVVDLAFDSAGNLWVAGGGSNGDVLEMISAGDLMGTGEVSPTAAATITSSAFGLINGSGSCLGGIDFDNSGNLWASVGGFEGGCHPGDTQLVEFTPNQLSAGGNLAPSVTIGQNPQKTNLFLPGPLRFGPTLP